MATNIEVKVRPSPLERPASGPPLAYNAMSHERNHRMRAMRMKLLRSMVVGFAVLICSMNVFAQTSVPATVSSGPLSTISEVDTYVKVIVAALTGIATLFGLPIVFLTYRKTRAEITKIELESSALREKQVSQGERSKDEEGNIHILVDRSPNTNIQVLADPRFLAPLLLLLDFIFAWVVLTLASHLLSIFSFGIFREVALVVLALALLLPIAKQVIRVRTVLRPKPTQEEALLAVRQTKIAVYIVYGIFVLSSLALGVGLLSTSPSNFTDAGRYFAWGFIAWGTLLAIFIPIGKPRFERYLARLHAFDIK